MSHRTLHSVTNLRYRVDRIVYMGGGERLLTIKEWRISPLLYGFKVIAQYVGGVVGVSIPRGREIWKSRLQPTAILSNYVLSNYV